MVQKQDFRRIEKYVWEIPATYRDDMRVPARIYASEKMLEVALRDRSVEQLVNVATLPGVVGYALAMPDIHQGYGFPIGGVAATKLPDGVISPGGVGYDIGCGIRVLSSNIEAEAIRPYLNDLASAVYRNCPSGVGRGGSVKLSSKQFDRVLQMGSKWALDAGYAYPEDIPRTESHGHFPQANPATVSKRARERGFDQVGTLGAGNHFIEIDIVAEVYDPEAAEAMGLRKGHVAVQIHTGSRGFGHQVCTDYVRKFQEVVHRYNIRLADRELVCAPLDSKEGRDYLGAMFAAANFAFANRQVLTFHVRRSFEQVLGGKLSDWSLRQVYDIAHNMAKLERHKVDGKMLDVCVHRKGATRAFGPGFEELPDEYRPIGQPVLVPGSMGTASYILVGTEESMSKTFGSTCHGAGRVMSRRQAKKKVRGSEIRQQMEREGIAVKAGSMAGLAEEASIAYKDVEMVVDVVHRAGIARKVARLEPMAVIKG